MGEALPVPSCSCRDGLQWERLGSSVAGFSRSPGMPAGLNISAETGGVGRWVLL